MYRILLVLMLFCSHAFADQVLKSQQSKDDANSEPLHVSGGLGYYKYTEPDLMDITGGYVQIDADKIISKYADGSFYAVEGGLTYVNGHYSSFGTGEMDNDVSWILRGEASYGYSWDQYSATSGFGIRYLSNDTAGRQSTTGYTGYLREQWYWYVPVRFVYQQPLSQGHAWSAGVGTNIFLSGKNISLNNEFHQSEGWHLNGFAAYEWDNYFVKALVDYWYVDNSTIDCSGGSCFIEPQNDTLQFGVHIGMSIR